MKRIFFLLILGISQSCSPKADIVEEQKRIQAEIKSVKENRYSQVEEKKFNHHQNASAQTMAILSNVKTTEEHLAALKKIQEIDDKYYDTIRSYNTTLDSFNRKIDNLQKQYDSLDVELKKY